MINSFDLSVRQLDKADASAFRALRLQLLREEGEKFGPTYEDEVALPYREWENRVTPTQDTRIFGLFDGDALVGITRVTKWEGDLAEPVGPTGRIALWGQTGVLKYLRGQCDENGKKRTAPLYSIRGEVTFGELGYKQAVAFIKEDNLVSQTALTNFGAEFMYKRTMNWPGRPSAIWNFYRITKESYLAAVRSNTANQLSKTLCLLRQEPEPLLRGGAASARHGELKAGLLSNQVH